MKRVLLRGPFLTSSGYGVHSRQIARWALTKKNWNVSFQTLHWGVTPWILDDKDTLIKKIMEKTITLQGQPVFDLSIQIQLPNEWDPKLAHENIGVTAAVETDMCNPSWIMSCNAMSCVVVPSRHTCSTITNTASVKNIQLTTNVVVIPESFYDEILDSSIVPLNHDFSTKFNFLVFGQLTGKNPENDRKNLFYTLKWMFEEFRSDDDVGIILKTNSGKNTKIDKMVTNRVLSQIIKESRPTKNPRVHFLHGKMKNREMVSLMKHETVRALATFTRGEGYGLPILEAAAVGLPVIATGWSGHTDFLGSNYTSVEYDLGEIHKTRVDEKIFLSGAKWAHPHEKDAKKKMRKFYQKPSMFKHRAQKLSKSIRQNYSFDSVSNIYDQKLDRYI